MKSVFGILLLLVGGATPAQARPVVLELFTSQSCSSCPPADALLASIAATRNDVLALDFHVDYWNGLQWHDPFSSPAATQRQRAYAANLGTEVYTPQLVIDGQRQAVGSARDAVLAAIIAARNGLQAGPGLHVAKSGTAVTISIGAGAGSGDILLVGYDAQHATQIDAGENAGRMLREINVVRSFGPIGHWKGSALQLQAPASAGDLFAVLVQGSDGTILAAGTTSTHQTE